MKRMRWLAVVTAGFVFLAAGCAEPAVLPESSEASAAPQDLSLGRYAGIEISAPVLKPVTDETVEQALSAIQREHAEIREITDRPVQDGDTVILDFQGLLDGEAFSGGTAENYELVIGSGRFIPGFEEQLIGAQVGVEKRLNLTFPESYDEPSLAGQPVVFVVTVHKITQAILPEWSDDFVREISDCDTVEAYREYIRKQLEEESIRQAEYQKQYMVWVEVLKNTTVHRFDEAAVEENTRIVIQDTKRQLADYNLTYEDYLTYNGMTEADFEANAESQAKDIVTDHMVAQAIAEMENLELTEAEYQETLSQFAGAIEVAPEAYENQMGRAWIEREALTRKVMEYLVTLAIITE